MPKKDDQELFGYKSADSIYGGDGEDTLHGGSPGSKSKSRDSLNGGSGSDVIYGDGGHDRIWNEWSRGDQDRIDGGGGKDLLNLSFAKATTPFRIDFDHTTVRGKDAPRIQEVEQFGLVIGGRKADVILGDKADNLFTGEDGNDRLQGAEGDDILFGSSGNDRMDGGKHDDLLSGGAGADKIQGGSGRDGIVGGEGGDRLDGESGADVLTGQGGRDFLYGGSDSDELSGGEGNDRLQGDAGEDLLLGADGNDWISGGDGDDLLNGGSGDDELDAGEGENVASGGEGDDRIEGGGQSDLFYGAEGNDRLSAGGGADRLAGGDGNDVLEGGGGDDFLSGQEGEDTLRGDGGSDLLAGDNGDDLLDGGENEDALLGGEGADTLMGSSGSDTLDGGEGADYLMGGDGADVLRSEGGDTLSAGAGADRVLAKGGNIHLEQGDDWMAYDPAVDNPALFRVDGGTGTDRLDINFSDIDFGDLTLRLLETGSVKAFLGTAKKTEGKSIEQIGILESASGDDLIEIDDRFGQYIVTGSGRDTVLSGDGDDSVLGAESVDAGDGNDWIGFTKDGAASFGGKVAPEGKYLLAGELTPLFEAVEEQREKDADDLTDAMGEVSWEGGFAGIAEELKEAEIDIPAWNVGRKSSGGYEVVVAKEDEEGVTMPLDYSVLDSIDLSGNYYNTSFFVFSEGGDGVSFAGGELQLLSGTNQFISNLATATTLVSVGTFTVASTITGLLAIDFSGNYYTITSGATLSFGSVSNSLFGTTSNTYAGSNLASSIGGTLILNSGGLDFYFTGTTIGGTLGAFTTSININNPGSNPPLLGEAPFDGYSGPGTDVLTDNGDLRPTFTNTWDGGAGNDTLQGTIANDQLEGGTGIDLLAGGNASDAYFVDHSRDQVIESSSGGIDEVYSSLDRYQLPLNTENLSLIDEAISGIGTTAANRLHGNAEDNKLVGLAGADALFGGEGADRMEGGSDSDYYSVDNPDDQVIEQADGGTMDTVNSSVNYTLRNHVESLVLSGAANQGTGSSTNNLLAANPTTPSKLIGGDGDDHLLGKDGGDTLIGGTQNGTKLGEVDLLTGGGGYDYFILGTQGKPSYLGTPFDNDDVAGSIANGEHAIITDFGADRLQLAGKQENYSTGYARVEGVTRNLLFYSETPEGPKDLIAIVSGSNSDALLPYAQFVG